MCRVIVGTLYFGFFMCYVLFFFFKQKTAYEMRISDWSSDVCSSDLLSLADRGFLLRHARGKSLDTGLGSGDLCLCRIHRDDEIPVVDGGEQIASLHGLVFFDQYLTDNARNLRRSETRRVGKECGSTR